MRLLLELATGGLRDRIDAMFRGDKINVTEDRGAAPLRAERVDVVDGEGIVPRCAVLRKMADFSEQVRSGHGEGTGSRFATS